MGHSRTDNGTLSALRLLRLDPRLLAAGTIAALLATGLLLAVPRLLSSIVAALPQFNYVAAIALGVLLASRGALASLGIYWFGLACGRAVTDLRNRVFARFVTASVSYHDARWSPSLVTVLTTDAVVVYRNLQSVLPNVAVHVPVVVGGSAILAIEHPALAGWFAIAGIPLVVAGVAAGRMIRRHTRRGQKTVGDMAARAQETLTGLRVVKALGREPLFVQRFNDAAEDALRHALRRVAWIALVEGATPLAVAVVAVGSVWVITHSLAGDRIGAPDVAAVAGYLSIIGMSARRLITAFTSLEVARGALDRIASVDVPTTDQEPAGGAAPRPGNGVIRIERVGFAYPEGRMALSGIDLAIAGGEVVALVGPNGAGKSTLLDLLLRFYEPMQGRILLNGQLASDLNATAWREQFALLTREPAIFSGSLYDNIALGSDGATEVEVRRAAAAVALDEFIRGLPMGYGTVAGEGGVRLSAGQRQRVALARVFLRKPSVLLLDEATTSLDPESEAAFLEALGPLFGKCTIIVTGHTPPDGWPLTRVVRMTKGSVTGDERVPLTGDNARPDARPHLTI